MGLDNYIESDTHPRGDSQEQNQLAEKVNLDIPTLQEVPDKLDLITELRRNGMTFEKAKQKVLKMKDKSDIDLSALEQSDEEDEEVDWSEFYQ